MRLYTQILLALAVAGCSASLNEPTPGTRLHVQRFAPNSGSFAYLSGMRASERLVVKDQATWATTWASISARQSPTPPAPEVNFGTQMIVVAALGERTSGGYTIRVDSAKTMTDGVTIWISTIDPGAECARTAVLTQPVDLASLPRIDGAVRFVDVHTVAHCQ